PQLMAAFGQTLVGGLVGPAEGQGHIQRQQPQVQASGKGRAASIVIEDALAVYLHSLRSSPIAKGQAQGDLIIFGVGMPLTTLLSQPTGIAQQPQMGKAVIEIEQTDDTHLRNVFITAGVQFPELMDGLSLLCLALGQLAVALIRTAQALLLQKATDARGSGQLLLTKAGLFGQFGVQRLGAPARMGVAPAAHRLAHRLGIGAQRTAGRSSHARSQSTAALTLPTSPPLLHRSLRPAQLLANFLVRQPGLRQFSDLMSLFKGRLLGHDYSPLPFP